MSVGAVVLWSLVAVLGATVLIVAIVAIQNVEITKLTGLDPRNDAQATREAARKVRKADS
jgi:hypothetical protein